jgi:hypothetical protein
LNGGNTGNAQYVAFFGIALLNQLQGAGLHADTAGRHRDSFCVGFAADIHHVCLATLIKMGKCALLAFGLAHFLFHSGLRVFEFILVRGAELGF